MPGNFLSRGENLNEFGNTVCEGRGFRIQIYIFLSV